MNVEVCRICATDENLISIFAEGNHELVEQIRLCANIQIDEFDCLPKFVCVECKNGLAFSYRLRKRGEETEKKLRQDLQLNTAETNRLEDNVLKDSNSSQHIEFPDEETWINDDGILHSPKQESVNDGIFEETDTVELLPENESNGNDSCPDAEDEFVCKLEEVEEIQDNSVVEPVEESLMELIEIRCVQEDPIPEQPTAVAVVPNIQRNKYDFECEICCEVLHKKSQYIKHINEHSEKRFHCGVCDKRFTMRYRYEDHMKNHLSKERAFPCTQCNKSYTNSGNMERHVRSAHKLERKFQCTQCDAGFCRSDILKMHMAKHTEERVNECEVCKKSFKTPQSLYYHKTTHQTKERPVRPKKQKLKASNASTLYMCDICDKISRHRSTHLNHLRTHTGEKPYKCRTCNKAFRTSHARSNHELLHTDKRPHECKTCDVAFRQKSHLLSHMLTHTKEKRHVCDVCQKAFAMRSNLVVHKRIHTGEMPYACNMCPKKFLVSGQFKKHKMSHTGCNEEDSESTKDESCKAKEIEEEGEFPDSQISLYIDDIIETNDFEEDIALE